MNTDRFRIRAWDKTNKTWIDPTRFACDARHGRLFVRGKANAWYEFVQCTGLKDSEGTLIWEGDLIEIKLDDYRHQKPNITYDDVVTPVIKNICEVRYRLHGGFVALVKNKPYKGKVLKLKNNYDKVIGNIYENPELLK